MKEAMHGPEEGTKTFETDTEIDWRKSSWSAYNGNCVEVAELPDDTVGVRDSKNPGGAVLQFAELEWGTFVEQVQAGEYDNL